MHTTLASIVVLLQRTTLALVFSRKVCIVRHRALGCPYELVQLYSTRRVFVKPTNDRLWKEARSRNWRPKKLLP